VQRRYQKVIEEAPAPHLSDAMRTELHAAAIRFSKHIGYRSLGTIEFLVDVQRGSFYFLEMNARIQVEHPVTEMITGMDLVAEQIAIANGDKLRIKQSDVKFSGHAIECRLNAEDTENDFSPSPGRITHAHFPAGEGLRIDTHIETGSMIPPYYDSMIGKLIASAGTRDEARRILEFALSKIQLDGIKTNISLHREILATPEFTHGGIDTGFLGRYLADCATDRATK
jgi:acetyl-CoA carboxylase biotin carboxylase subunit